MALVQVLLQITSLSLLDGCCLLDSAAFKVNPKECQLLAEVSNSITELCLPLLLAQPGPEGLCCQHTRPGRSLSTAGNRRLVQLWSLKEAVTDPAQVMAAVPALAVGWFSSLQVPVPQVLCDATERLRLWHSLL